MNFFLKVNFFIFTYFNRKFRRELSRVCFHAKKGRNFMLRTPSHQSFRHTNSFIRAPQQNLHLSDVCIHIYVKPITKLFS